MAATSECSGRLFLDFISEMKIWNECDVQNRSVICRVLFTNLIHQHYLVPLFHAKKIIFKGIKKQGIHVITKVKCSSPTRVKFVSLQVQRRSPLEEGCSLILVFYNLSSI